MSGFSNGKQAVAEALANAGSVAWNTPEDAMELATIVINKWIRASNPVGKSETIYDDFYRLREVALAVLRSWDGGYGTADQDGVMEGLRGVLLSLGAVVKGPAG